MGKGGRVCEQEEEEGWIVMKEVLWLDSQYWTVWYEILMGCKRDP